MSRKTASKLVFMASQEFRLIVIRPVGNITGGDVIESVASKVSNIHAPWTFDHIIDLRRFSGHFSDDDMKLAYSQWRSLTKDFSGQTHVALVSEDIIDHRRMPALMSSIPGLTVHIFRSYPQALGWLKATNREAFLESLEAMKATEKQDPHLRII